MKIKKLMYCVAVLVAVAIVLTQAYPHYPDRLPNGNRVPHPCKPNFMWYGVGHTNSKGGGERNVFGQAFKKHGYEWNACLCLEDSDGDGITNGEELGDPNCVWTKGQVPEKTTGITHPGICDPFYNTNCVNKNSWVDCSDAKEVECDAIKQPDVINFTLSFPRTPVPAAETTYICQAFDLSSLLPPGESHLIATAPDIDNKYVMHHSLLYACDDKDGNAESYLQQFATPTPCGMASQQCTSIIGGWSVGDGIDCLNEKMGYAVGGKGVKIVILEFHWNNPEMKSDYTDASGMTLFVTPKKRPFDAGTWVIGPPLVYIPPGFQRYSNPGGCSSACTSLMMEQNIYVTSLSPHMHYLGAAFNFQQYRNGKKLYEMTLKTYMYDDPYYELFNPPLEVRPGDDLRMECIFQSRDKTEFTFYGESTQAEMCLAFITYYPYMDSMTACLTNNGYGFCNNTEYPSYYADPQISCNIEQFTAVVVEDAANIYASCDPNGLICLPNCKSASSRFLNHPCMTSPAKDNLRAYYTYSEEGKALLIRTGSCEPRPPVVDDGSTSDTGPQSCNIRPPVGSAQVLHSSCWWFGIAGLLIMAVKF